MKELNEAIENKDLVEGDVVTLTIKGSTRQYTISCITVENVVLSSGNEQVVLPRSVSHQLATGQYLLAVNHNIFHTFDHKLGVQ